MARRPRLAAQAAAVSLRTPIPRLSDNEDEDMPDTPAEDAATPQDDDEEEDQADGDGDEDAQEPDEEATPSRSERISRSGTPRRRGRPPGPNARVRRSRTSVRKRDSDNENNEVASDTGTSRRKGVFRGHRGGRWARNRGTPRTAQAPVDDEGNTLEIVDDEVELPDEAEGEEKVDKLGYLQQGREYRVRTFTLLGRGQRLYMLSTEPARCIGFRDSYLFFQKHKHLYKIIIDDDEKRDLIDRDLIPHSYKGRAIGVVTARSVFREFGAKIVIGGRKITDDYYVQRSQERGDVEGEIAVPEDRLPPPGEAYNRNQYVAWHGASAVYHTGAPSVPLPNGKTIEVKRKRVVITTDNWMLEHAREASRFNSLLALARKDNDHGIYDIHTNVMQEPSNLQPTHARWKAVEQDDGTSEDTLTKFAPLPPIYSRNFRIHDLCLESAPRSALPRPNQDAAVEGLAAVPAHVLDELPEDCRQAFDEAVRSELSWQGKWLSETLDGQRTHFLPSVEWYPK